jgi:hypothetical protein
MENPTSRTFLIARLDLHLKRPKIEITEKKRPTRVVIVGSFSWTGFSNVLNIHKEAYPSYRKIAWYFSQAM